MEYIVQPNDIITRMEITWSFDPPTLQSQDEFIFMKKWFPHSWARWAS